LKTLVISSVGELAVAMSQVEVIGVRKSFPTRNLSAEATTFSLRGLGLYRTAVRIVAPRLESPHLFDVERVTADVPGQ